MMLMMVSRNTNFLYDDINDGGWLSFTILIERQSARLKRTFQSNRNIRNKKLISSDKEYTHTHTHTNRKKIEAKLNLKLLQRVKNVHRFLLFHSPYFFLWIWSLYH